MVNLTERSSPEVSFSKDMFSLVLQDAFYVVSPFSGQFCGCFTTLHTYVT